MSSKQTRLSRVKDVFNRLKIDDIYLIYLFTTKKEEFEKVKKDSNGIRTKRFKKAIHEYRLNETQGLTCCACGKPLKTNGIVANTSNPDFSEIIMGRTCYKVFVDEMTNSSLCNKTIIMNKQNREYTCITSDRQQIKSEYLHKKHCSDPSSVCFLSRYYHNPTYSEIKSFNNSVSIISISSFDSFFTFHYKDEQFWIFMKYCNNSRTIKQQIEEHELQQLGKIKSDVKKVVTSAINRAIESVVKKDNVIITVSTIEDIMNLVQKHRADLKMIKKYKINTLYHLNLNELHTTYGYYFDVSGLSKIPNYKLVFREGNILIYRTARKEKKINYDGKFLNF